MRPRSGSGFFVSVGEKNFYFFNCLSETILLLFGVLLSELVKSLKNVIIV